MTDIILTGRSSSHFTRIVRIFAIEMKIDHAFQIVRDLTSGDVANYAGNPALKVPVLQAMTTEVSLIMANLSGSTTAAPSKLQSSLHAMMSWLDEHAADALALPPHDLSFLEVSLFCLLEHLEFRQMLDISGYVQLMTFRQRYARRAACVATAFKYD